MKSKNTNYAEIFRNNYKAYPLKGFVNDGHVNSISDEEAKKLEEKYLDKWIIVEHPIIKSGKKFCTIVLARVVSLLWSAGPWGGEPFRLQIEYALEDETDVHPTYENYIKYIFGKEKPSKQEIEGKINSLKS